MKKIFSLFIGLTLLLNVGLSAYLVSKVETLSIYYNQDIKLYEEIMDEISYVSEMVEQFTVDTDLLKKALLYDSKKARAIFRRWFKGVKKFKKELKKEEQELIKSLREMK